MSRLKGLLFLAAMAVPLAHSQPDAGDIVFENDLGYEPETITNLSSGTALTVGVRYYDTFSANRTFTISGTPGEGDKIFIFADVTSESVLTYPSLRRELETSASAVAVTYEPGYYLIVLEYANSAWWLKDLAQRVSRTIETGITASATRTQGQGALTAEINELSTVADENDTVTLKSASAKAYQQVINNGVNTAQIFPASGDNLGEGLNSAMFLPTGGKVAFRAIDATNWEIVSMTDDNVSPAENATLDGANSNIQNQINLKKDEAETVETVTMTGNENNWAPGSFSSSTDVLYIDPGGADRTITGINSTGFAHMQLLTLVNVGPAGETLFLDEENVSSDTTNQFLGGDVYISGGARRTVRYDTTQSRWLTNGTSLDSDFLAESSEGVVGGADAINIGSKTSFELPNSAAPTTDAAGEIALDTTITDHQPLLQYYDGGENMSVIAIDTSQLPALDNEIPVYDAATDKFVLETVSGSGGTYVIQLSCNTRNLGDGETRYVGQRFAESPQNSFGAVATLIPKTGTIVSYRVQLIITGTLGTSETGNIWLRLNDTTDFGNVSTIDWDTSEVSYSSTGLSQAVTAGDTIALKYTTPTFVTNPNGVVFMVLIEIDFT